LISFFFLFSSELTVPTIVVLNTSNQQYFLLDRHIKDASDMVQFINSILDGTVPVSNSGPFQRDKWEKAEEKLAVLYL
jgi:thioredoxin domain-containing protein 10